MATRWENYQRCISPIPESQPVWRLHGKGLENLGIEGAPEYDPVPQPGRGEVLARVDAVSVCASDAKMVRLGNEYPLFKDRDLAADPPRLGHELALTVVAVGSAVSAQFAPGQRLALQPDVMTSQGRTPVGVILSGGFAQYMLLDEQILSRQYGPFAYPVEGLDYGSVAVSEPWACVERTYRASRRLAPREGGRMLIRFCRALSNSSAMDRQYRLLSDVRPSRIDLVGDVSSQAPLIADLNRSGAIVRTLPAPDSVPYDDIVLLDPDPAEIADSFSFLAAGGLLCICSNKESVEAGVPVGRVHYESIGIVGTTTLDIESAYEDNHRCELAEGGALWVAGAGGPMGQMHVLRALEQESGPTVVVATNRGAERVEHLRNRFEPLAAAKGKRFIAFSPAQTGLSSLAMLQSQTGFSAFTDAVVVAANADLMQEALAAVGPSGVVALFGGLPPKTIVPLRLDGLIRRKVNLTGTSGSSLDDQKRVLSVSAQGALRANMVISAVAGVGHVRQAVKAVAEKEFSGKVVVFPHLRELPLLSVDELAARHPEVARALAESGGWSADVEQALFELYLPTEVRNE